MHNIPDPVPQPSSHRRRKYGWWVIGVLVTILIGLLIFIGYMQYTSPKSEVPLKDSVGAEPVDTAFEPKHGVKEP